VKRVGLNNCLAYDRWDAFIKSAHPCAGPGGPPTGRQRPEKSSSEDREPCVAITVARISGSREREPKTTPRGAAAGSSRTPLRYCIRLRLYTV
jgi:hypothetical protein